MPPTPGIMLVPTAYTFSSSGDRASAVRPVKYSTVFPFRSTTPFCSSWICSIVPLPGSTLKASKASAVIAYRFF
jgi:hypothetical protein